MCLCDRLALLNSKIQKCLDRHIQHDWSLFDIGNFLPPEQWHIEPIDRNSVIGNDSRRFSRKKTDKGVQKSCLASSILAVQTINSSSIKCNAAMIQEHIAFLNATESTGLQLGLDSYRAPWKIICIRTAFKEYKTYGADLYKEALTMLARGWEGDPDSLRSGILQGMMRFVALYQGEYDPERLVKRLHTVHPMTLVRDEKSLSGTVRYKYMMLILRTYNGASRRRNLPIKP